MKFEFATATRILFGWGALREAGSLARNLGRRTLLVTGRDASRARTVQDILGAAGVETFIFQVPGEPETGTVTEGTVLAQKERCQFVTSFGGGSAIDAGKAISAMLTNPGGLLDYLEVVGSGKSLPNPAAPFVAIPTTAGTGSEVTRNAVLGSPAHGVKVSLRSPHMLPRVALVDPELTLPLPRQLSASTGMDALTQLIEPYVCARPNPLVDPLCSDGIQRIARSLARACDQGTDSKAREDMSLASLFGGLALANAGLGAVHGFAGAVGGMFRAPHGAVCAALLPHVMSTNVRALHTRNPQSEVLWRYGQVARWLTGEANVTPEDGISWVVRLVLQLGIPPLSAYGITQTQVPGLVEKAAKASSMKANPIVLTQEELTHTLKAAL